MANQESAVLRLDDVSISFDDQATLTSADLTLEKGEFVALVGPSGSGKSTLLRCAAGLLPPDSGRVLFAAESLYRLRPADRTALRARRFGFVAQHGDLIDELTVRENIQLPLELNGMPDIGLRTGQIMRMLGLDHLSKRHPWQISGGERQRTAIARALVHHPDVLFADEPTGALDAASSEIVADLLVTAARRHGTAVLLATHDLRIAERADRVATLTNGRIVASEEVLTPDGGARL
ncbi:ABC transporter ATP-binding protein [Microbispora sp. CA-135349]|uniref:ABC transporter ATP-binding protein n=1 Tax=Microbispora sp. CA-135349 TaxID=3239953 RepID=UPI003D93BD7B